MNIPIAFWYKHVMQYHDFMHSILYLYTAIKVIFIGVLHSGAYMEWNMIKFERIHSSVH